MVVAADPAAVRDRAGGARPGQPPRGAGAVPARGPPPIAAGRRVSRDGGRRGTLDCRPADCRVAVARPPAFAPGTAALRRGRPAFAPGTAALRRGRPAFAPGTTALRRGRPAVVICLHGWAGAAAQFAQIVPALVERGHTVLAFDGPGHGRSSGRESSILDLRDTLVELASRERGPVSIVAHSGGAAAATLAIRDGLTADRLAFVGPTIDPACISSSSHWPRDSRTRLLDGVKRETQKRFGMPWTGSACCRSRPRAPSRCW